MPILLIKMAAHTSQAVVSPCISICQMHEPTGWCKGCYRTLDEIAAWALSSESGKQAIWQQLPERHTQMNFVEAKANMALMMVCRKSAA